MNNRENDVVLDLLVYVQKYYPLGMPHYYNQPRVCALEKDEIVLKKINSITDHEETAWSKLISEAELANQTMFDMSYLQFPCYPLYITMDTVGGSNELTNHSRQVVLIISLLCPYYTVFYLDSYVFKNIWTTERTIVPTFRIAYSEILPEFETKEKEIFEQLRRLTEKHFFGYTFLRHRIAFGNYIKSDIQLEGQANSGPYPLFSYLFDGYFDLNNLEIRS